MAVFLVLLTTLIAVTNGRPEWTDDQNLPNVNTTVSHCRTSIEVVFEDGQLPHPTCLSRCSRDEEIWFDGVAYKRLAELEEYSLMVEMTYINGTLHDCNMVPYETEEEVTARREARERKMDPCFPIDDVSQDETLTPSHTEQIPSFPSFSSPIPIHKILEGFSRVGDSSTLYMVSPEVMTWHDALPYCEGLGSDLATLNPSQERKLLQGKLEAGVWTARDHTSERGNYANAGSAPTKYSHALCEHPLVDDLNQYVCPDGFWRYKSSCYISSTHLNTYREGEKFCSERSAYPVFINSQDEFDFLKGKVKWYTYIGYTDIEVEGLHVSKRFGLGLFTRWGPGEPNDKDDGEDCVTIDDQNNWLWNDVPCSIIHKILCERLAEIRG